MSRSSNWGGLLLSAGGAIGFASKGIFAKFLYAHGLGVEAVLALRSLFSLPLMWAWVLWFNGRTAIAAADLRAVMAAALAGVLCYGAGALLDFHALTLIPASVERVVLFSYPAMIVLAGISMGRGRPSPRVLAAVGLTYAGIFLTVGGFDPHLLRQNAVGSLYVLVCAATFAGYFLIGERHVRSMGSQPFALFAMTAAGLALILWFSLRRGWHDIRLQGSDWLLLLGLAVFATALPMFMAAEGVRRIGAQRSALAATIGPVATMALAAMLLGERLHAVQLGGSALIIFGILVLELKRG